MIQRAVQTALRRQPLYLAAALAVVVFGLVQLDQSRVQNLPEFNQPVVEVQTEALGLSALEVEQLITVPLEADLLNGVAFVEDIRSQSMPSLSSIVMTFEPGTDLLDARQLVQERLTQAAGLPNVSRPPAMVQPLSSESRVMMIGITSDELSLIDLGVLARWTIRPKIMGVDGVANVAVWGRREQQLQVQVDLDALVAEDLPLQDIVNTAGNALWVTPLTYLEASTPGVGGFIDGPNQRIGIRHVPAISRPEDLANVVVDGRPDLVIGDVATVVQDHQPLIGDAVVGDAAGLYLVVEKFPWSNTADTTAGIDAALAELEPGLTGVDVDAQLFRPANYLDRAIGNLQLVALAGLVLLILALRTLSGSWRRTALTALSTVVILVASALVLLALDVTINSMVVLGLAIAAVIIIDDLVRITDMVQDRLDRGLGLTGGFQTRTTVWAYVAIVVVAALVPALFMGGVAGEFLPTVGVAMALALLVSLVASLTVVPAMAGFLLRPAVPDETPNATLLDRPRQWYRQVLDAMVSSKKAVVVGALVLIIVGAGSAFSLNRRFVPDFRQTDLLIGFDAAPGVSLAETRRVAAGAAQELADLPGVEQAGAQVGRAVLSEEITNVNGSQIWLTIDPGADYDATLESVQRVVDGYPGFGRPTITTYANDRIQQKLQVAPDDLVVRVYGEDPEQLRPLADDLLEKVAGVDGVRSAEVRRPPLEPSVEIEVDLELAREAQVKPGDIRRAAATVFGGIEVGSLFENQQVFEVVVWSGPEFRSSITSVEQLLIDTPSGEKIPLGDLADVRVASAERIIERDAVSRFVDIVADVDGRSVSAVQADISNIVTERGLPYEYHVGYIDGQGEEASEFRQFLAIAGTVAVALFLLLQAALSSWRLAAILVVTSAAAMSGGIVATSVAGDGFSIGSMAGMVAVVGLALRAGLGLFKTYESLQLDEVQSLGSSLVRDGARRDFAPAVLSAVAVVAVTLPAVVLSDRAGLEVVGPFAVVALGGAITTTIVTIAVLPALYLWLARPSEPPDDLFRRDGEHHLRPGRTIELASD